MKKLPKFNIKSDEPEAGISKVSFVAEPAIKLRGLAFKNDIQHQCFKDDIKNRIVAPALIPDIDIYRRDEDGFEYYVSFTTEEIDKLHAKFMRNLNQRQAFNLEHTEQGVPAYILEAWIIQSEGDKAYDYYGFSQESLPLGSLMLVAQITSKKAYKSLIEGDQIGFSVEGLFDLDLIEMMDQKINNFNKIENNMKKQLFTLANGQILMLAEDGTYEIFQDSTPETKLEDCPCKGELGCDCDKEAYEEGDKKPEDELQEEVPVEEVVVEEAPAEEVTWYTKEEVDSKLDELFKLIGVLKAKIDELVAKEVPVEEVPVEMTIHQKFTNTLNKAKNSAFYKK